MKAPALAFQIPECEGAFGKLRTGSAQAPGQLAARALVCISHSLRDYPEFKVGEVNEGQEALGTAGLEIGATRFNQR